STVIKSKVNKDIKQRIGKEATKLINTNDSLCIASGSTVYAFAEQLVARGSLNVITPSIAVAVLLNEQENITVKMLGGVLYKNSLSVRGQYAIDGFSNVVCDKLFFGVDGIDAQFGYTCATEEEAVLTRKFMSSSAKIIVLTDSSKFGKKGYGRICPIDSVDMIITDDGISDEYRQIILDAGIELITVPRE
ncbi:MAG: DeoR/GlpR transcriptional regulator, partial [Bacteroidales bacterium]|nr:DeoR/GlpR transcriptional regulator [Bacteroidales bacterium]